MTRVLYLLLGLVAAAAAVLSFDALLGLAMLCGFRPVLAWLLPVTVDAGAAAGSLVWLTRPAGEARRFGRVLALVLLAGSVAGNALGHGLVAYGAAPAWWVVVAVSAVPPAVLGAVVHLAVLAGRAGTAPAAGGHIEHQDVAEPAGALDDTGTDDTGSDDAGPAAGPDVPPDWWGPAAPVPALPAAAPAPAEPAAAAATDEDERAARLIADGAGRRRLARELDITEHAARALIDEHRAADTVGATR